MLSQTRAHIMTIINITVFHTRFLSPTDQKCAESATYWQSFYYRPPGKFRFTHLGKIVKMLNCYAKNSTHTHIYIYNMIIDMDFLYQFNLGLIAPLFTGSFHEMFEIIFFFFQKFAGLWLVGKVDNHVTIYGSKVAEGFLAFQRRLVTRCSFLLYVQNICRIFCMLCIVEFMWSVLEAFTRILQGSFTGTGAIIWLPQCQWSNPEGYG